MIAEGVIALIWAAAGVTCYESSQALFDAGAGCSAVVYNICQSTMGRFGSLLALIGVIICPISSGDTAYRSARLTLSDWFRIDQSQIKNRLLLTIPLLGAGSIICGFDYDIVWRYFSWANQTLAMIALWTFSVYLKQHGRNYLITVVPAAFMSAVTLTYFMISPECMGILWNRLHISSSVYYPIGMSIGMIGAALFCVLFMKNSIRAKLQDGMTQ